ncbi:phage tail protein [Agrobacterium vitis]|uniref:phage tail-collar fiber domain-containing protein n=1 Tax=Agrobacterium vitis TaxID=373 RepID=UPI0012E95A88|nr:phage tail protein [Agrobacterium vitis]MVA40689.1 phage tail protein [Agrobacterium vitis]NSX96966.1 phage tail protein [Agrobacterium vitis]NSZ28105.1 phage tail protein [Agrobacterium vitis]UJL78018.1 phage tail protein [Agrobacterium vitis]UJL83228.1 phage tail protein [Agrobacterium vitis]
MKALVPVLTRAGMRAVFNASRDGLSAKVSHLAFGDSAYSPTGDETALKSEKVRIPIAGGSWVGGFTVHMTGLLDAGPSFWIKECGMILSDGTLLAVWSDPATPLAYKTDGVPIVTAFDLTLEALPKGAVTVQAGSVDLSLFFGVEFARIGTAITDNFNRHMAQAAELAELRRQIASINARMR